MEKQNDICTDELEVFRKQSVLNRSKSDRLTAAQKHLWKDDQNLDRWKHRGVYNSRL